MKSEEQKMKMSSEDNSLNEDSLEHDNSYINENTKSLNNYNMKNLVGIR